MKPDERLETMFAVVTELAAAQRRDMWDALGLIGDDDQDVDTCILVYRTANRLADEAAQEWKNIAASAKDELERIITKTGRMNWKTASGSAYVSAASKTVTYDAKALDALSASSPELAAILRPHRLEKERAGTLTIRG